jgi:hypothetical protein
MGSTLAHLLLQHKKDLGVKHVTEVTIFRDKVKEQEHFDYPQIQLLYKIEDVPEPEEKMSDVEGSGGDVQVRRVVRRDEGHGMLRVHEFSLWGGEVKVLS